MESEKGRLKTKLGYLLEHSTEHVEEFKELARKAQELGETEIHNHIRQGIEQVTRANQSFEAALKGLES